MIEIALAIASREAFGADLDKLIDPPPTYPKQVW